MLPGQSAAPVEFGVGCGRGVELGLHCESIIVAVAGHKVMKVSVPF